MPPLARRNLFHDKVRLAVTLNGVVFAVVLVVLEMGLFVGFEKATSGLPDHSTADLWIAAHATPYIDQGMEFNERRLYQVLATPGVAEAAKCIVRWGEWKEPDGRTESVQVVGLDPEHNFGMPWNLVAGDVEQLKVPHGVIVDEIYKKKLAVATLGDRAEMHGHRLQVVGFTRGIQVFTASPYVFTTFKNALDYVGYDENKTTFVLVKAAAGVDKRQLQAELRRRLPENDVYLSHELSEKTRNYWMYTTGAGVSVMMSAALGLLVGLVIVTQTIYATTMDHIGEFATLKAMGAPNSYVIRVILTQAAIAAVIGYFFAAILSLVISQKSASEGGVPISVGWEIMVAVFFVTVAMCMLAAVVSIRKVMTLDPASVFRG